MLSPSASQRGRNLSVDALRGLSILLAVMRHFQLRVPLDAGVVFQHLPRELWSLLCNSGNQGVRIFFVISGFLITSTSLRRWKELPKRNAMHFFRLRFARIAPTLLALLYFSACCTIWQSSKTLLIPKKWATAELSYLHSPFIKTGSRLNTATYQRLGIFSGRSVWKKRFTYASLLHAYCSADPVQVVPRSSHW